MILYTENNKPKAIHLSESSILLLNEYGRLKPIYYSMDDKLELGEDPYAKLDRKNQSGRKRNFSIKRNGEEYWVSRSSIVTLYVFCRDERNEWCLLASQRGENMRHGGVWNVVSGYLDYGETLEKAASRECFEECGVDISGGKVIPCGVDSSSNKGYGVVNHNFAVILNGTVNDFPPSMENCEGFGTNMQEVQNVSWFPLSALRKSGIRRDQVKLALEISSKLLGNSEEYTELYKILDRLVSSNQLDSIKYNNIMKILKN
jgi:ADP-ribose pyrophosphatase YjhB (NUDIX family)